MTPSPEFLKKFDSLPLGAYGATALGLRWRMTKQVVANGRSQKLEAEELGGNGYISFNLYRLATGQSILNPCEMPANTVIEFVMDVMPD